MENFKTLAGGSAFEPLNYYVLQTSSNDILIPFTFCFERVFPKRPFQRFHLFIFKLLYIKLNFSESSVAI